jgi:hypothetical protein
LGVGWNSNGNGHDQKAETVETVPHVETPCRQQLADIFEEDIVTCVQRCQSVVVQLREFRIARIEHQTSRDDVPKLFGITAENSEAGFWKAMTRSGSRLLLPPTTTDKWLDTPKMRY